MRINVSIGYQGRSIKGTLQTEENEALTSQPWSSLYRNAQSRVPYYVAASVIVNNGKTIISFMYDGVSLFKHLKTNNLDPQTRLKILQVNYIFFKCHSFTRTSYSNERCLPLKPANYPTWESEECLEGLSQNEDFRQLLFDSLNAQAVEEGQKAIDQLASIQFAIGSKLMPTTNVHPGIRWIWCAAQNGLPLAKKLLGVYALDLDGITQLKPNTDEAQKWLKEASNHGDAQAAILLEQLNEIIETPLSSDDDDENNNENKAVPLSCSSNSNNSNSDLEEEKDS